MLKEKSKMFFDHKMFVKIIDLNIKIGMRF